MVYTVKMRTKTITIKRINALLITAFPVRVCIQ